MPGGDAIVWQLTTVALGFLVGHFIALASEQMPKGKPIAWVKAARPMRAHLMSAGAVAIAVWAFLVMPSPFAVITSILGWWLLWIAVLDAEHFWLPDRLTLPLGVFGLIAAAFYDPTRWLDHAIGAGAGFLVLAAIAFLYRRVRGREGLGGGDPRLLAAGGAWIGWIGLPSVLVWASAAALSIVAFNALRGQRIGLTQSIPLGTFLALGIWLTWLYGPIDRLLQV